MKFYNQVITALYLATTATAFVVQKQPSPVVRKSPTELNVYGTQQATHRGRTLETRHRMDRDRGNSPMRYNDYHAGGNRGRDDYERRENRGSRTYNSPFTNRGRSLGGNTYGSRDRESHGGRDRYGSEKGLLRSDSFNRHGGNSYNDRMGSLRADQRSFDNYHYDRSSRDVNADYGRRSSRGGSSSGYGNRRDSGYDSKRVPNDYYGNGGHDRHNDRHENNYYGSYNSGYGRSRSRNEGGRWSNDAYGRRTSSTYRNSFGNNNSGFGRSRVRNEGGKWSNDAYGRRSSSTYRNSFDVYG